MFHWEHSHDPFFFICTFKVIKPLITTFHWAKKYWKRCVPLFTVCKESTYSLDAFYLNVNLARSFTSFYRKCIAWKANKLLLQTFWKHLHCWISRSFLMTKSFVSCICKESLWETKLRHGWMIIWSVGIYYDLRIQQISFLYKNNYFNYNKMFFKLQI